MPWCETPGCGRSNLMPDQVMFDEHLQICRCLDCAQKASLSIADESGKVKYQVLISSTDGVIAKANYGGFQFSASVSTNQLRKLFKPRTMETGL